MNRVTCNNTRQLSQYTSFASIIHKPCHQLTTMFMHNSVNQSLLISLYSADSVHGINALFITWTVKFEIYKLSQQWSFLALYWYNINVINIRMVVYSVFIFSPRYIRSCFANFWARSKSLKYLHQKHGVMSVKRKQSMIWSGKNWYRLIGATSINSQKFASESTSDL